MKKHELVFLDTFMHSRSHEKRKGVYARCMVHTLALSAGRDALVCEKNDARVNRTKDELDTSGTGETCACEM